MKSFVTATIEFSFRGKSHSPSVRVELDRVMRGDNPLKAIYDMVADSIGLDAYTHEYDVLIMEDVIFSDPEGPVTTFVKDGKLDLDGFRESWLEQSILEAILPIAKQHLAIDDLEKQPLLKQALIACYRAGQNNPERYMQPEQFYL